MNVNWPTYWPPTPFIFIRLTGHLIIAWTSIKWPKGRKPPFSLPFAASLASRLSLEEGKYKSKAAQSTGKGGEEGLRMFTLPAATQSPYADKLGENVIANCKRDYSNWPHWPPLSIYFYSLDRPSSSFAWTGIKWATREDRQRRKGRDQPHFNASLLFPLSHWPAAHPGPSLAGRANPSPSTFSPQTKGGNSHPMEKEAESGCLDQPRHHLPRATQKSSIFCLNFLKIPFTTHCPRLLPFH